MLVDFVQVESEFRTHFSSEVLFEVEDLAGVFQQTVDGADDVTLARTS